MKNNMKRTTIITTIICLIPVLLGVILYSKLPDTMVTHWGTDGTPNGWQPKFVAAIVFPGILLVLNLLVPVILKMDPKNANISDKMKALIHWIMAAVSVFCSSATLAAGLGKEANTQLIAPALVGVLFIAIGNYLPKTTQSYTVGIKLPWTLHDEENWNKTHRMAGFLWVIGGIVILLAGIMGAAYSVFVITFVAMVLIPTVYSYMLYRKSQA